MKTIKLNELVDFHQGLQVSLDLQSKEEIGSKFIRIIDFTSDFKEVSRYILSKKGRFNICLNDIIMIRYGSKTAGKVFRGVTGIIANNMFKISLKHNKQNIIDNDYLFHYLNLPHIYAELNQSQTSSTMPAITFNSVGNLIIPLPELDKQKELAKLFNLIDNKKQLNNFQNIGFDTLKKLILENKLEKWLN